MDGVRPILYCSQLTTTPGNVRALQMPTYRVTVTVTYEVPHVLTIEAEDEETAESIAVHACSAEDYNSPAILDNDEQEYDRNVCDAEMYDIEELDEDEEKAAT